MVRLLAASLIVLASSASAQDMMSGLTPPLTNIMPSLGGYDPISIALKDRQGRSAKGEAEVRPPIDARSLRYTVSMARRQANYARFVERTRAADPAAAARLAADLRGDPIARLAPDLARMGLKVDNVADAYTGYWLQSWGAVNPGAPDASPAQIKAVQDQAARALMAAPEMATASEAAKQELAESLWIQAFGIAAAQNAASGDPAQLAAIARAVRIGATRFGLRLDTMTLTDSGFVPRGGRLGTNDVSAPAQSSDGTAYLGAALAGLGLGGLWLVRGKKVG